MARHYTAIMIQHGPAPYGIQLQCCAKKPAGSDALLMSLSGTYAVVNIRAASSSIEGPWRGENLIAAIGQPPGVTLFPEGFVKQVQFIAAWFRQPQLAGYRLMDWCFWLYLCYSNNGQIDFADMGLHQQ